LVRRLAEATVHPLFVNVGHLEGAAFPDDLTASEGLGSHGARQGEFLIIEGERALLGAVIGLRSSVEGGTHCLTDERVERSVIFAARGQ